MKNLSFHPISFPSPIDNILYDEVMLNLAEEGRLGESFRLWESPSTFIVLGRAQNREQELFVDTVKKDRIPVLKRISGGGTVVQGPGCLNFAFVLDKETDARLADINKSYRYILESVSGALARAGVHARFRPVCDLVITEEERKFSGNAQRRARRFILHHGTILYQMDLALVTRYLRLPQKCPQYRKDRPHEDFIVNISSNKESMEKAFREQFSLETCSTGTIQLCRNSLLDLIKNREKEILVLKD